MSRWDVHHAQVLDALATMPDASFDAVLTDPPYGLGSHHPTVEELIAYLGGAELDTGGDFMGKDWHVPSVHTWREIARVLKPGGHALSFGGSRTGDLISLGLRAASFEIRDTLSWMYAQGFPKSQDASKAIDKAAGAIREVVGVRIDADGRARALEPHAGMSDGWEGGVHAGRRDLSAPSTELARDFVGHGTALKPAWEPIILARKPLEGTLAQHVARWGTGTLAIDAARIEGTAKAFGNGTARSGGMMGGSTERGEWSSSVGRWPANVLFDEETAQALDAQTGDRPGMSGGGSGRQDASIFGVGGVTKPETIRGDSGGASRFFYVAKASRAERELGCRHLPKRSAADVTNSAEGAARLDSPRTGAGRTSGARNFHPTVKPVSLDRYLATLLLPPARSSGSRRILVPYAGSGSEMIGALLAGWDEVIGIERDADYLPILRARVALAEKNPRAFEPFADTRPEPVSEAQVTLFGGLR